MKHPREEWLALEATGDLPWWRGLLVRRHTGRCAACAAQVAEYRSLAGELAALPAPEPPPALVPIILAQFPAAAPAVPLFSLRSVAAMASLIVAALLVTMARVDTGGHPTPPPPPLQATSASTSATGEAVVGETTSPSGRQRLVLYAEAKARPVELSAGAGRALAAHSDPRTGALLITGVGIEGLP